MKKRILSLLLVALLLASLTPMAAFADMKVYVTVGDEQYHSDGCRHLGELRIDMTLSQAIEEGYTACPDCTVKMTKYAVEGGSIYFDKDSGKILNADTGVTAAAIPSAIDGVKVTGIGDWAFAYCEELASVTVPDTVTEIGEYAFFGCGSIAAITLHDSVKTLGEGAFQYCIGLESVKLPKALTEISDYAFDYCARITGIEIPASVKSIGSSAFEYCASLGEIVIPEGVASVGDGAFLGCSAAEKLSIPASVKSIGEGAFDECMFSGGVYYAGDLARWRTIKLGANNDALSNATLYFGGVEHKHSFSKTVLSEPSCTAPGRTEFVCECGVSYIGNEPKALGHSYVKGVCSRCGASDPGYKPTVNFTDVPSTAFYYDAVQWAVANDITTGVGNNKFDPNGSCTRGQVVTFLWRAAGKPTVSANVSFTDVKPGAFYYEAVKWAVANGITTGVGNNKFDPDAACTRGQVVTFLHRAAKSPAASAVSSFSDVPSTAFYYNAVNWAVGKGVTKGTGNGRFSPDDTCTRGQVVTFLYRAFSEAN